MWLWHYQRWTLQSWQVPTDYRGDAHEVLARLQAAAEGDTWPMSPQVIERLGAPFQARWNAYPAPDKPLMLALGGVSRWIGLFAAANLGLLLAQVSAALAFYLVARQLRCRWEWAWAGALLFAYTYQAFHRGLAHFSFVFTWTIPLGLLAVWLVAGSRRLRWHSGGAVVCIGAGVALGAHNPYYYFFWLQLMGWALVAQWLGARRRAALSVGLASVGLSLLVFVAANLETWIHIEDANALPLLERNYSGTERYALKPVEMFIPPTVHRWEWLAFFGYRYNRWSDWRGEPYLPYLGVVGMAGLIWLVWASATRLLRRRSVPGTALSVGWFLGYASVGGVTNLLAFFWGLNVFRATNRVTIFISALVLFYLMFRLSRLSANWPRWLRWSAAGAVVALGLLDQVPRSAGGMPTTEIVAAVQSDRELGHAMEAALPEGAMVFQLPVLGFPEVLPPHRLSDYEHFRPYLVTSHLRYSYGAAKYRARGRWQRDLETLGPAALVQALESYGFSALYLNRKGFPDRAERLLSELTRLGYDRRIEGSLGNQVVILLRPQTPARLPLARALTYGKGWHLRTEDGVRWAYGDAAMSFFNPFPQPLAVDLHLGLSGVTPRELTLELEGRKLQTLAVGAKSTSLQLDNVTLVPGVNRFTLRSSQPAERKGNGPYQLRSFGLHAATIKPRVPVADSPPAAPPRPPGSSPR